MKLLFLTAQPPFPPDQGAKLRNAGLIRIAAEAGHEVHLLTFVAGNRGGPKQAGQTSESALRTPPSGGLDTWCRRVAAVPAPRARSRAARALSMARTNLPDLMLRLWSPEFLAELRRLVTEEHYEVVQVGGFELACYLRSVSGAFTVFDEFNVEYLLQQRAWLTDRGQPRRSLAALYSFVQSLRLRRWEARLCAQADAVLAVSERDAAALRALSGRDVVAVPNGIDLGSTPFRSPAPEPDPNLLFDGTMSFRPNHDAAVWFAREILPLVHERRPEARFWVVGREPLPELVAYNFRKNGVVVTGEVPSVRPYWERAGIYVLPMRMGGGVRFKALEAMARGVPLVSTELGVEGTPALPCRDYLRADRPTEFASGILRLLEDPALRRDLTTNARQTVAAHDWTRIAPRLLEVYESLAASHSAPSPEP